MTRIRRSFLAVGAVLAAVALALAPGLPAAAAGPGQGWVRLAHMSPDTAEVNISLSSVSGDVTLFELDDVGYGAVSNYVRLDEGTYALAMVPSKTPDAAPILNGSIDVTAGQADTVAALGLNDDLETTVFTDDLSKAGGDRARVRTVQASVMQDSVDVSASGTSVADGAGFGDVSDYASVPSGAVDVKLTGGDSSTTAKETLKAGTANTLFVIDDSKGELTVVSALDSAAAADVPTGSVAAGTGAPGPDSTGLVAGIAALAGIAGLIAAGALVRRRRLPLGRSS